MASGSQHNVLSVERLGYESTHCTKEMCSCLIYFYFFKTFDSGKALKKNS